MSFAVVARTRMCADFGDFVARNREMAGALADAYVAAGGRDFEVPAAFMRVKDAAGGALVLLPEPTAERLALWSALPDLRSRARAVLDAVDAVPPTFTTACFQHAIARSITALDALFGGDWSAALTHPSTS
jgi:hypothetical protein